MKALVICPVVAYFKSGTSRAEYRGQIVLPDVEVPDGLIGASSSNHGFRKLVPFEELPDKLRDEIDDAGMEFATGNCGYNVTSVTVELAAGNRSVSATLSNSDDRLEADEALHDVLFEFMMNNMHIEYGTPEALVANRGIVVNGL